MKTLRCAGFFIAFLAIAAPMLSASPVELVGRDGPAKIVVPQRVPEAEKFAAQELSRYLGIITGKPFIVVNSVGNSHKTVELLIGRQSAEAQGVSFGEDQFGADGFLLRRSGNRILIAGINPRGTLYGVYAFLEKLGCRWFAPNFKFYSPASGELVPRIPFPSLDSLDEISKPSFPYRVLYIEEGRSHTPENLVQMVDWMAKADMDVLNAPIDYDHEGRAKWDNYRSALIPELKKRDLLIDVGGHGYQNFLPQEHYFAQHPEWFGMIDGKRSPDPRLVFSTANPQAVATYIQNVKDYLRAHPEIDIFDCLPPDETRWSQAPEDVALGTPSDRQMLLLNQLVAALRPDFPEVTVQFNAYSNFIEPPQHERPASSLLMSFDPYLRNFETSLFNKSNPINAMYVADLDNWVHGVIPPGQVMIYSYITKYAWRSLPILIPHLIGAEVKQYREMNLGGMGTYSEPASWATYEVDHYIAARMLWNADRDVDAEMADYTRLRYSAAAVPVGNYLRLAEDVVPHAVAILGTVLNEKAQKTYIKRFEAGATMLAQARQLAVGDPATESRIDKLDASRRYAINEMQLRLAFMQAGEGSRGNQITSIEKLLAERRQIIQDNTNNGVLLIDERLD